PAGPLPRAAEAACPAAELSGSRDWVSGGRHGRAAMRSARQQASPPHRRAAPSQSSRQVSPAASRSGKCLKL
ncbi:MAG TPA: hypothetical protein VFQ44_29040, partial [Streptosporangiaceae bacterium]|nr:hypothetical protein [Streptosporangiaceae bacterium]